MNYDQVTPESQLTVRTFEKGVEKGLELIGRLTSELVN
jgi:hypothetical protein